MTRLYDWAPHDQRARGSAPRNHGHNITLVAALAPDGLHEPWLIEGAMETTTFEWYIAEQLGPTLQPGQVVVLDNLSVHKATSIRQTLAVRGRELLFLPPYSPDFTPIEQAFSKLKARLRGLGARTREAFSTKLKVALGFRATRRRDHAQDKALAVPARGQRSSSLVACPRIRLRQTILHTHLSF